MEVSEQTRNMLNEALGRGGMRSTRQREHVFHVLLAEQDHPTADEVYARAKVDMPTISLATVYNCLETLVECHLVRQVNWEREPTRYCPNLAEHGHFYCRRTGSIIDINLPSGFRERLTEILPEGYEMDTFELSFRGKTTNNR